MEKRGRLCVRGALVGLAFLSCFSFGAKTCDKAVAGRATVFDRLNVILKTPLVYVENDEFTQAGADAQIRLSADPIWSELRILITSASPSPDAEELFRLPPVPRNKQGHLFRKMNYLKFFVSVERERLAGVRRLREEHVLPLEDALAEALAIQKFLVWSNTRLVRSVMKHKHDPEGVIESDLFEHLIKLVQKFDYGMGFAFITLAQGALEKRALRALERAGRFASRHETQTEVVLAATPDYRSDEVDEGLTSDEGSVFVEEALSYLEPKERQILELRLGLLGDEPLLLKEIGERMHLTGERVRQLEARALRKLREHVPAA